MTQAQYDEALAAWAASIAPGTRQVNVPEFVFRHPPTPSPPEVEPEPPALAAWEYGVTSTAKTATLTLFEHGLPVVVFTRISKSSKPDAYAALLRFRDAIREVPE
jgi:hypothetical protein